MVKANHALSNSAQNVKSILRNSNRKCDLQNLAFFSKSASSVVFRSRSSVFLGPDHERSVRTVSASIFASTITTSGVLKLLTGSPVATTLSCQDLTILFFQLGCEAPFFFYQSWGYDNNNWLCPRVCLTVRVIRPLFSPYGSQLFFWNAFTRDGVLWNGFVVNWLYLPNFQGLFVPAWSAIPFSNPDPFQIQALRINFSLLPGELLLYACRKVLPVCS